MSTEIKLDELRKQVEGELVTAKYDRIDEVTAIVSQDIKKGIKSDKEIIELDILTCIVDTNSKKSNMEQLCSILTNMELQFHVPKFHLTYPRLYIYIGNEKDSSIIAYKLKKYSQHEFIIECLIVLFIIAVILICI